MEARATVQAISHISGQIIHEYVEISYLSRLTSSACGDCQGIVLSDGSHVLDVLKMKGQRT